MVKPGRLRFMNHICFEWEEMLSVRDDDDDDSGVIFELQFVSAMIPLLWGAT